MTNDQKIPEGWSVKKIIDVCPLQRGFDLPEQNIKSGNYPIVYSNGIKGTHNEYKATAPGVVTGRSGTIGKVTYVDQNYWPHNTSLWVTDFKGNNPKFIFYKLQNLNYAKFNSGSGVPTLNRNDVHIEKIFLPPLSEQEKIAEILSCWDEGIEKLTSLITLKEKQKKSLMQKLLTGKHHLKGFSTPWQEVKLGNIGDTYTGLSGKSKDDFGTGSPFITYMNIFSSRSIKPDCMDFVKIGDNENQNTIKYGDILFTASSETPDEVGMSSVLLFEPLENIYLNSFCFGFRLYDFNALLPQFASFYMRSDYIRKKISILAQGATRFNLSKNELLKMNINVPSDISEQRAIAEILSKADEEIELLNKKLEAFKLEKKALMQQLLTGKIRVKVN